MKQNFAATKTSEFVQNAESIAKAFDDLTQEKNKGYILIFAEQEGESPNVGFSLNGNRELLVHALARFFSMPGTIELCLDASEQSQSFIK